METFQHITLKSSVKMKTVMAGPLICTLLCLLKLEVEFFLFHANKIKSKQKDPLFGRLSLIQVLPLALLHLLTKLSLCLHKTFLSQAVHWCPCVYM